MIAQVLLQLQAAAKDSTVGLDGYIAQVASDHGVTVPAVGAGRIYALDAPPIEQANWPALFFSPAGSRTDSSETQNRRDHVHSIAAEYVTEEPDDNQWRATAMYVDEALCRFLDYFNANNESYVGSSGAIVVLSWSTDYVTWQQPPNARRGFVKLLEILARDTF